MRVTYSMSCEFPLGPFSLWSSGPLCLSLNALDLRNVARVLLASLDPMAFLAKATAILKAAVAGNLPWNVVVIVSASYDFA